MVQHAEDRFPGAVAAILRNAGPSPGTGSAQAGDSGLLCDPREVAFHPIHGGYSDDALIAGGADNVFVGARRGAT